MSGSHPTFLQKLAINKKLTEVCIVVEGFAQYRQGWSDATVAEFCNAANPDKKATLVNANHVMGVRKIAFGPLKTGRENQTSHSARLDHLEKWLATNFDFNPLT